VTKNEYKLDKDIERKINETWKYGFMHVLIEGYYEWKESGLDNTQTRWQKQGNNTCW
jgi:hypothetical protein